MLCVVPLHSILSAYWVDNTVWKVEMEIIGQHLTEAITAWLVWTT